MSTSHASALKSIAHAAADVRRRDLEVMANFRSFPRVLWSEAKNRDVAFAQQQVSQAFLQIRTSAEEEKRSLSPDSELHWLADAICDYATGAIEVAECYVKLAEFMDAYAIRRPFFALYHSFRWNRMITKTEKRMDEASRRIKLFWPAE